MLENCRNAQERWGGVHSLIDRWLAERRELIVRLCALTDLKVLSPEDPVAQARLNTFCQTLLDYLSTGHFEIYNQLAREAEDFKDGSESLLRELMPDLSRTTDDALAFNDAFDTPDHCEQAWATLHEALSRMAETLEDRFALEDRLIDRMHTAHKALLDAS